MYVADQGNHKIRAIFPNQTVITLAGGSTTGTLSGDFNGACISALFFNPSAPRPLSPSEQLSLACAVSDHAFVDLAVGALAGC